MTTSPLFITGALLHTANHSVEVRTLRYERSALLNLAHKPALALGVAPAGLSPAEDWIEAFSGNLDIDLAALARDDRWHLLSVRRGALEVIEVPGQGSSREAPMEVWLSDLGGLVAKAPLLWVASAAFGALDEDLIERLVRLRDRRVHRPRPVEVAVSDREASNRARVNAARQALLERLPVLTSEQIAERRGSTTQNASQLAADLREARQIFGVRFGKTYYYPAFQFDAQGKVRAEVALVRKALGGDPQGWDTLEWFAAENAALEGKRPSDLISKDAKRVEAAARRAHWSGRD